MSRRQSRRGQRKRYGSSKNTPLTFARSSGSSAVAKIEPLPRQAHHLILEGHALGIVFRKPGFRGVGILKDLEVAGVSDLLAIHVNENGHRSAHQLDR